MIALLFPAEEEAWLWGKLTNGIIQNSNGNRKMTYKLANDQLVDYTTFRQCYGLGRTRLEALIKRALDPR